ncbi:hypothetical protein D1AOALGA4SA_343 [Olavius algarvensis Delta 1 endosymbiont]|nr:hypothetical protein D1AOALGA4SA_343 [Olavius algarvensis Delta 1 endosymbiont]
MSTDSQATIGINFVAEDLILPPGRKKLWDADLHRFSQINMGSI